MEVWKIIFLSKWVICRFHVNLPGCIYIYMLEVSYVSYLIRMIIKYYPINTLIEDLVRYFSVKSSNRSKQKCLKVNRQSMPNETAWRKQSKHLSGRSSSERQRPGIQV